MNIIKPTIGQKVWFWPNGSHIGVPCQAQPQSQDPAQAMDATVVFVHGDRMVNLLVLDHNGIGWNVCSVNLKQEGDATPQWMYAQWTPYQAGRAKKEAQIAAYEAVLNRAIDAASKRVELANRFEKVFVSGIQREDPDVRCADLNLKEAMTTPDQAIEQEIQAKGKTAPRVTPADLQANIVSEHYFTAADGVGRANNGATSCFGKNPESLSSLTFCVLVLRNGFTVTGESACASPENFDAEIGRKIARQNAESKCWPLMGYALKEKLASA